MMCALVLSKTADIFLVIKAHLKSHYQSFDNAPDGVTLRSIRLEVDGDTSFIFYDRSLDTDVELEQCEIPVVALIDGYKFSYLVECRSEDVFCKVLRSIPSSIDILVCDCNEALFRPDELTPGAVSL